MDACRVAVVKKKKYAPWNPKYNKTESNSNDNLGPGCFFGDRWKISIVQVFDLSTTDIHCVSMAYSCFHNLPLQNQHEDHRSQNFNADERINVTYGVGCTQLAVQRFSDIVVEIGKHKRHQHGNAPTKND